MSNEATKRMINIMIVLSMILAPLAILVFSAEQASAGPIVTIELAGQTSGASIENGNPGDDILFDVKVTNNGDAVATINLSIVGTPLGWSASLTGENFVLAAGNSITKILTVSIPSDALETASATLTIEDSTNNKQDTGIVKVDQVYNLMFTQANTIKSSLPDSTVSFTLPINNTGNGIDTTSFTHSGGPQTWSISFDSAKNLQAFTEVNLEVTVYIPAEYKKGTNSITIKGTSEDSVTETTKTLTVTVLPEYGLTVTTLPNGNQDASPGSKVSYTLKVTNVGNAADRFNLLVDSTNKTAGWTATLGTHTTPQVASGNSHNVTLQVTAPVTGMYTDLGYVNVTVTSEKNGSQSEMAYTITGILSERYLSLGVDNSSMEGPQGGSVSFNFTLTNSGNCLDRVDITATPPAGWSSPNISPTYFALEPDTSGTFTVVQSIPSTALHKGFSLTLKAKSRDDSSVNTTSTVTVDVEQDYDVQVTIPGSNSKDVNPGDTVVYNFTVKNKGNGEDTISLSQDGIPVAWSWALSDSSVSLPAEDTQSVSLTVTIPSDYENFGPLEVELIAQSDGDANAKDNSSKIIINVQKTYSVILTCNKLQKSGYPEDTLFYIITINNDGNAEDLIKISVDAGTYSSWASLNDTLFTIAANDHSTVNLTVEIPDNQPAGNYAINITATSQNAKNKGFVKTDTISTVTKVKPRYKVYLFPDGGNVSEVDAGKSVTYYLGVQNKGLGKDTFDISFTGDYPFTNWVSMAYENYTITDLGMNQIKKISFKVSIPMNVHDTFPGITSGTISVTGTSRGNPANTYVLDFETTVKANYDGSLTTNNDFDSALPGENVTYTLELKNTGSAASDIFGLEELDCPFDDVTFVPAVAEINSSDSKQFLITVRIDNDAKVGDYFFNISARSAGPDRILSGNDEIIATLELKMGVLQNYDVRATCSDRTEEAAPQEWAIYEIEVENEGNGEDTFDITKYSTNNTHIGWTTVDTSTLTLESEETATITVNVSIPHSTRPMEVIIQINVTSREDDTAKSNVVTITTVTQEFAIRLTSNNVNKDTDPGGMVKYYIDVKNDGTGTDTIEVSIVTEGSEGTYSSWASIPTNMLVFTLEPSMLKRVTVNVTPPEDQEVGTYEITLKAESTNSPDEVIESIITTTGVNAKRDVALEVTEDRKEVVPNLSGDKATVTYSLKVTNKGTDKDRFTLQILGSPYSDHPSWIKLSTTSINSLNADADITVTVTVTIPNNEAPTDADGFNTVIYVYSPGQTSDTDDDIGARINLTTVIKTAFGLELATTEKHKETDDLESSSSKYREVAFPFEVKNIGTGDDIVKFEIDEKPSGWDSVSIDLATKSVAMGASQEAVLTVKIDREEAEGDYDIKVMVTSRGDDTLYEEGSDIVERMTFTVEVTSIHEIRLTGTQTAKEAKPGETVTYTITVKNKGNGDDSINLKLPDEIIKWATRTISPSSVDLTAGESIDITVTMKISGEYTEAIEGIYKTNITGTAGEGSDEYVTYIELSTTIDQEYALEVTSNDWEKSDSVDSASNPMEKQVDYTFEVKNKGNGPDSFKFRLTGDHAGWGQLEMSVSDILQPGESQEITVTITIDDDFDESEAEDYDIGLAVTSVGDDTVKDEDNTFRLTIEEVYFLELSSYTGLDKETLNPVEESTLTYKVDVKNSCNTDDTVKFTVKDKPADWTVTILPSTKAIKLGKTETISVDITPDDEVEEDTYNIKIRAQTSDGTNTEFTLKVEIQRPILKITKIEFEEKVEDGEETTITVTVRNDGFADAEDVVLSFFDTTEKKSIGSNSDDTFTVKAGETEIYEFTDWDVEKITKGKHKIEVSYTDPLTNEEESMEKMVEVKGGEEKLIEQKQLYYVGFGVSGFFIVLIIIILLFSRTKRPVPDDLKDEIARAKAEAEKERPREEESEDAETKKVKKEDIEQKLLKKKTLPGATPALPESTEKDASEKPTKRVKIKCPKCEKIQTVTSPKRPLDFECDDCGMKLILKK